MERVGEGFIWNETRWDNVATMGTKR